MRQLLVLLVYCTLAGYVFSQVVPQQISLPVIFRDFEPSHPDFQYENGEDYNMVAVDLGEVLLAVNKPLIPI